MGCWGITAFESDAGLDAVDFIRGNLPEDGKLELGKIIEALRQDEWNAPPDVKGAKSHTSPMALTEVLVKFLDRDIGDLDYDEEWAAEDNKFSAITSFTASKESVRWLRDYVSDTLQHAKENAELRTKYGEKWGGWFEEKNWIGWQEHMATLVSRLNTLLASPGSHIELIPPQEQKTQLDKKLEAFSAEHSRLIREIVEKTVLDAVTGAEADEDKENIYCEIDYDVVHERLSLLNDMGAVLTVEKLSEFIDAHPAVDYSDIHNTGITIYLNSPEILQTLGLLSSSGITDMQL